MSSDNNPNVLGLPSQIRGRNTYVTQPTAPGATAVGFLLSDEISPKRGWLSFFMAAMHETQPAGTFILLFDASIIGNVANGDLALLTLGPTPTPGGSILFSEAVAEGEVVIARSAPDYDGRVHAIPPMILKGFPFDKGCQWFCSSTPGRLTQFGGQVPAVGARVTARYQSQGGD